MRIWTQARNSAASSRYAAPTDVRVTTRYRAAWITLLLVTIRTAATDPSTAPIRRPTSWTVTRRHRPSPGRRAGRRTWPAPRPPAGRFPSPAPPPARDRRSPDRAPLRPAAPSAAEPTRPRHRPGPPVNRGPRPSRRTGVGGGLARTRRRPRPVAGRAPGRGAPPPRVLLPVRVAGGPYRSTPPAGPSRGSS